MHIPDYIPRDFRDMYGRLMNPEERRKRKKQVEVKKRLQNKKLDTGYGGINSKKNRK